MFIFNIVHVQMCIFKAILFNDIFLLKKKEFRY